MEMRGNTRLDNSWGDAAWETAPTQAWPEEVIEDRPGIIYIHSCCPKQTN